MGSNIGLTMLRLLVTCSANMCETFVGVSLQHLLSRSVSCLLAVELNYLYHVLDQPCIP